MIGLPQKNETAATENCAEGKTPLSPPMVESPADSRLGTDANEGSEADNPTDRPPVCTHLFQGYWKEEERRPGQGAQEVGDDEKDEVSCE